MYAAPDDWLMIRPQCCFAIAGAPPAPSARRRAGSPRRPSAGTRSRSIVDVVVERGVVHEDVDRAERGRASPRRSPASTARRRCRSARTSTSPLPVELLHRGGGPVLVDLGDHDLGPFGEEPLGVREADALARAGDDRDLVLRVVPRWRSVSVDCLMRLYFFSRAIRLNCSVTTGVHGVERPSTPSA